MWTAGAPVLAHPRLLSPKSELSRLSKKSLEPTLWTTMSHEYTERVQLISVARMASVANTLPCVLASCETGEGEAVHSRRSSRGPPAAAQPPRAHLADDGVVGGGDCVEDPLDATQRLLAPRGDAVEGLVVVLEGPAALAGYGQAREARHCLPLSGTPNPCPSRETHSKSPVVQLPTPQQAPHELTSGPRMNHFHRRF